MIRKIVIATAIIASFACCMPQKSLYSAFSSGIDYKEYADVGFYITESNSVSFEYTPISSLVANVKSGYVNQISSRINSKVKITTSEQNSGYIMASAEVVLEELYQEAIKLGANGIINLKIVASEVDGVSDKGLAIPLPTYSASGMAIMR